MNSREDKYYQQGLRHGQEIYRPIVRSHLAVVRQACAQNFGLPEAEAVRLVTANYRQRLEAAPPVAKYPELRGIRECVAAFDRGCAEGAGFTDDEMALAANFRYAVANPQVILGAGAKGGQRKPAPGPGCTLIFLPKSDRGALVANNLDDPWHADFCCPKPVWIVANQAGLIIGAVSSGVFDDEIAPEIFPVPAFLLVSETCRTAREAADLLIRLNHFWGPCNCMVADRQGNSGIIEKSSCRYGLRWSADGFSATTAMAAEEPIFKAYLWETRERSLRKRGMDHSSCDWAYWKAAEGRSARLLRLVEQAKANPTYAGLERIIYDHTGLPDQVHLDGSTCHPDEDKTATNWTLRTVIWVLDQRQAYYSCPKPPVSGHLTTRHSVEFPPAQLVF